MEVIILAGIVAVTLVYNVSLTLFNVSRGVMPWHWDRQCQTEAIGLWSAIVVCGVVICALWFGLAALLSIWPFWLLVLSLSLAWFGVGELLARRNERKAPRQTLAERMTELRQQGPLPPWAAGIEARQASSVVERRNAPQKRGLLARLDDWMGL